MFLSMHLGYNCRKELLDTFKKQQAGTKLTVTVRLQDMGRTVPTEKINNKLLY